MSSLRNPGRVAGIWYLLLTLTGPLRLVYIPTKLFVPGNATSTINNIAAHERLFRFGILGDLASAVILVFLVLAFYRLFEAVDQNLAVQVVIFGGVMPTLIDFISVVSDFAVLTLARGEAFLSVFDKPQRDALAMLFLRLRDHQNTAAEMLWGIWLLPLAVLVYKSRFCRGSWASGSPSTDLPMWSSASRACCYPNTRSKCLISLFRPFWAKWRSCCGS